MLIAVSAVLLALGLLAYRRQLGARDGFPLLLLRIAVLVLLALVLIGSAIRLGWTENPRKVVVLSDLSQSVTALGLDSMARRAAVRFPLSPGLVRQFWSFADSAVIAEEVSAEPIESGRPGWSSRTEVARALDRVARTRPAAIVLITDGQDNGSLDARAAATRSGVPVYAVGVGAPVVRNVSVTDLLLPAAVRAGESTDVRVRLKAAGFAGEAATVRLLGRAQPVTLPQGSAELETEFRVVFERPGLTRVTAFVDSVTGESDYADNALALSITVGGGALSVGYYTGHPGTQTRFIVAALATDSGVSLRRHEAVTGRDALPSWFDSVDVLILDGVSRGAADDQPMTAALRQLEAGTGVLLLADLQLRGGQILERLLGSALMPGVWKSEPIEVTAAGRLMPWFGDGADVVRPESVPPFAGFRLVAAAPAGADTWLRTASGKAAVFTRRVGRGKLVYVAGYPLWRWAFAGSVGGQASTPLRAFLGGVTRYLAERDSQRFKLEPSRPVFLSGEPARFRLSAVAPGGGPWTGLDVVLSALADSSAGLTEVPAVEVAAGVYEAGVAGLSPGTYTATARVRAADAQLGSVRAAFSVAGQSLELANTGRNRQFLQDVARASGGAYFDAESLPGPDYAIKRASFRRGFVLDPRRTVWLFVIAALLAGLEWVLRRRKGLM